MEFEIWWTILITGVLSKAQGNTVHSYLFNSSYNNRVRPSPNITKSIQVTFGLSLHEIIDMNDKNQRLDLRITIREHWTDPSLSWNKTQFGGTEYIAVHPESIWIPDIVLYNNAGEGFGDGVTRTQALIRYDGFVQMNIPSILKSTCKVHLENYPFDEQDCKIKFGSWTYDSSQLGLRLEVLNK
ncbi:Neuronal acetylcholine receptor subunit alpha-10 [Exaiptasia diaphana]|nr:Neuronal acetylcholine receptor subunit alpha-10 [Exaiptasia diaphana]